MKAFNNEADLYFSNPKIGYGQWNIICEVTYKNEKKEFSNHFTDSLFIDELSDMKSEGKSFEEIQQVYYDKFFNSRLEEKIVEWMFEIDNK
jgi:hypothetical protein